MSLVAPFNDGPLLSREARLHLISSLPSASTLDPSSGLSTPSAPFSPAMLSPFWSSPSSPSVSISTSYVHYTYRSSSI
jgi:hypothetical protein